MTRTELMRELRALGFVRDYALSARFLKTVGYRRAGAGRILDVQVFADGDTDGGRGRGRVSFGRVSPDGLDEVWDTAPTYFNDLPGLHRALEIQTKAP
jgi:hypothetical protein